MPQEFEYWLDGVPVIFNADSSTKEFEVWLDGVPVIDAEITEIAANLSVTLGSCILSSTGAVLVKASVSATLADATLSSTASVLVQASLAATLDAATLSSTVQTTTFVSLTKTLDDATLSSQAVIPIIATVNVTLDAATLTSSVSTIFSIADLNVTLDNATLSSTVSVSTLINLDVTLGDVTSFSEVETIGEGLLTDAEQRAVAFLADFQVEETLRNNIYYGESAVFAGDGVDDLDRIIARMNRNRNIRPRPTYTILVGDRPRNCNIEDIFAIRNRFVEFYGDVANPSVFEPPVTSTVPFAP